MLKIDVIKLNRIMVIVALLLCAALVGITFAGFDITVSPFTYKVVFNTPAMAVMNGEHMYVLDTNSMRILSIEGENIQWSLEGGSSSESGFYKAQSIAIDDENRLIVHDVNYDETGSFVISESIKRFDTDGSYIDMIYEDEYEIADAPTNSGYISDITCIGDNVYVTDKKEDGLLVTAINVADGTASEHMFPCEDIRFRALDTAITDADGVYFVNKAGGICYIDDAGEEFIYRPDDFKEGALGTIAYNLDLDSEGNVYFTDIGRRRIIMLNTSGEVSVIVDNYGNDSDGINNTPIRYPIQITADATIVTTDAEIIEVYGLDGTPVMAVDSVNESLSTMFIQILGWLLIVLLAASVLYFVHLIIKKSLSGENSNMFKIGALSTALILAASTIVATMSISYANENTNTEFQKNVQYIARLVSNQINGDAIEEINTPEDVYSDAYNTLKDELNTYITTSNETDYGLYYLVYKMIDGVPCIIIDSDLIYPAIYPSYVSDLFDSVYYEGNDEIILGYEDAYGIWACAASPLYNSAGEIVGLLEFGLNMVTITETRTEQNFELVLSIIVMVVMLLFILSEGIGFYSFYTEHKTQKQLALAGNLPIEYTPRTNTILRTIMFFTFAAQSMQDSFISVLALNIYEPVFGLPRSIGGALPITLEMLMIALFSFIGGNLIAKFPIKRVMIASYFIAILGYGICMSAPDFYVLMVGKVIVGIGIGLIYVSINTAATCVSDKPGNEGIFADVNAGMMAGTEIGIIVGASIYGMVGYHMAYGLSFALCILAVITAIVFVGKKQFAQSGMSGERDSASMSAIAFIFKRKSLAFFIFSIIPTLVAVAFFEYYFPIFGNANGLSETRIGQVMLIYGLAAIYIGPTLTRFMLKAFGDKLSVTITSITFAAALILFTLNPNIWMMLLIAFVFGLITGFSYSVQSSYFSKIDYIDECGEGRATGIYAMFQSISQSFAPILIGYMSLTNIITGTLITSIAVGAGGILFLLLSFNRVKAKS